MYQKGQQKLQVQTQKLKINDYQQQIPYNEIFVFNIIVIKNFFQINTVLFKMNIMGNSKQFSFERQELTGNIMGNGNLIYIKSCEARINVMGNCNKIYIKRSNANFTINGNANTFEIVSSEITIGINGNNNQIKANRSEIHKSFINGVGNSFENRRQQLEQNNIQPNNTQQRRSNNSRRNQPQNNSRNHSNQPQRNNRRRNQQINQHTQNYVQNIMSNFLANTIFTQNFPFQNNRLDARNRNLNIRQYIQPIAVDSDSEEQKGLNKKQIDLLQKSKRTGKNGKCTICLEEIKVGDYETYLFCFHSFHSDCVNDWLAKKSNCPICQINIRQQLEKLYS